MLSIQSECSDNPVWQDRFNKYFKNRLGIENLDTLTKLNQLNFSHKGVVPKYGGET